MADENRKASRIPGISKYKAPGESLVKINQGDVANSQLFLPDVDDPSTYDEWGKLFNTLTFPQLTCSLKELKAFLDEWKLLGDATIAKSNSSEYSILNNNLKTVGVKVGFSNLTTADTSRLFVHGFDKEGRPADKNGFFFLNDDLTELANAENPAVESGTTGSIVAERVTISKASLGPISTTFVNQITFLIIEKSGAVFVPKLISLPKDQINELATDYKFNAWNKASDSLSSVSTIATDLNYPSAPTNYAKWHDSASGDLYNPYASEVDSIVTRETTSWNSTSRTVTTPANVSNYSIKTRLLKEIFVLGICDTKLVSSKVVFNNFSMFPTPVSFLSFQLLFEADRNFLDFRVKDFKDKEALFKKIHDEINNRVLDTNKIKGEIDRNLRPYTLKKQNEAGEDLIVLEYFNNTANSVVQSLFKNDVLDNAIAYPAGLATRKRLFSASLLNNDLNEVWLHGRNSAKVLKLGLAGSTTNTTTELLTGFKINGDLLTTGAVSMSSTLGVTGAVTLSSTLAVAGNTTFTGYLAVNGGDITTSATTFNLLTGTATTVNAFTAATTLNLAGTTATSTHNYSTGATASGATKTINLGTAGSAGSTTNINLGSAAGAGTFNSYLNTVLNKTLNVTGATALASTLGVSGVTTLGGDVFANSGRLSTTATTFNLLAGATNTLSFGVNTATFNVGSSLTATQNANLFTGATASGSTKTIKIGGSSTSGSTTNIELGSAAAGALGAVNIYQALIANKTLTVTDATSLNSTLSVVGDATLASNLSVNGGTIATTATTFNLLQNTIDTAYLFGNTNNVYLASNTTGSQIIGLGTGVTSSGSTKQLLFGTNGLAGSTTNFVFGSSLGTGTFTSKQDSIFEKSVAVIGNTTLTGTLGVTGVTTLAALLTANAGISATTLSLSSNATIAGTLAVTSNTTLTGDLAVNGGDLTSSASTFNLLTASSGQINAFSASGTISIGGSATGAQMIGIGNGSTVTGQTKTINIGQNGVAGSTTTLNIGSAAGTTNINTYGTHAHTGSKSISSTLTVAGVTTLNGNLVANGSVILGDAASDSLTVNATSNFIGPVTIANLLITGSTIENLTINNSFLSKGSNTFDQLIYAKAAINSDTDIVALGEVKANKLKEKYLTTGIEKYLGDIYQAKYEGAAGVNVLNLPKKTILAITNGARAFGSVGVLEPANYLTGTYDFGNKIYSNTDYKFGISFESDWLVFKNDSFIKYPAITGTKTDFTIYTCFDDTLVQTAASTTYEFLKFTNGTETLEIGFATNVKKDNLSLVIKRNGTSLVDTITTWPATETAKTAGEVFRDKNIKNRSISFNLFNNVLSVVVGGELVASYVFAALTNNLTTLTVGKSSTNALICSIKSLVIGQFSSSEFSKYTSAWVPNVDYNQELQSNEGKFYIKKELDYVEIVSGKQKPILLETVNSFKKQNTFEVDTTFLKPITITDNGRSTTISNHVTEPYGTSIISGGETSIYLGSTSYNKPRYNDGATINDILTEKHAIQTPDGKTVALANGASLDTLTKTGLNNVYGFASAPTASKSWFVDTKVSAAGTGYMRENIQSFDGLEDYFRIKNGGSFGAWIKNWNANNDGSGSGLDADLLRGLNSATTNTASTVVTRGASGEFAAGVVTVTGLTNSGNASMSGTLAVTGNTTLTGVLAVNGGDITSSATTFNLLNQSTNIVAFLSANTAHIGSGTGNSDFSFASGVTAAGNTKNVSIAVNGITGSTTNVYVGSTAGTSTISLRGNTNVTSNLSVAGATTLTGQLIANGGVFGTLTGNATTATTLQTARTLWGQSFNGAAAVAGDLTGVGSIGISNITDTVMNGISLHSNLSLVNGMFSYGISFTGTAIGDTHGSVTGSWATYFTVHSNQDNYGWIFRNPSTGKGNLLSISAENGNLVSNGSLTAGTEGFKTGAATIKYNTTTKSLDFNFA